MAEPAGLDELRARVRAIEGGGVDFGRAVAPLGQPLDAGLPWGGLPYRALHEVGGLAATSAVAAFARRFLARGGSLVWCRNARVARELGELYGPGLARFGLTPERVILVQCRDEGEVLWSFEEALRCRGVACAVAEIGRLDLLLSRRLQLAVEAGGGAGLVLRPEPDPAPNAALTRWRAEPVAAADGIFWRLILWRAKGGAPGVWTVRWDEQALSFAPAASTASATTAIADTPQREVSLIRREAIWGFAATVCSHALHVWLRQGMPPGAGASYSTEARTAHRVQPLIGVRSSLPCRSSVSLPTKATRSRRSPS